MTEHDMTGCDWMEDDNSGQGMTGHDKIEYDWTVWDITG